MTSVIVMGGQFGSEGKGAVCYHLAQEMEIGLHCRAGAPQAGHTVRTPKGDLSFRVLPAGAALPGAVSLIGPGAIVDLDRLRLEILNVIDLLGWRPQVVLDPEATVLLPRHRENDQATVGRIGSTGTGVGPARADRAMRLAPTLAQTAASDAAGPWEIERVAPIQRAWAGPVLYEGTQGAGLSLTGPWYPYATSQTIHPLQLLADMEAPLGRDYEVWGVYRTLPIRVGGSSGPLYGETSWEDLALRYGDHIQPERTTVTQRVRRVGRWDRVLANWSAGYLGIDRWVLTFVDYLFPEMAGSTGTVKPDRVTAQFLDGLGMEQWGDPALLGTGFGTYLEVVA